MTGGNYLFWEDVFDPIPQNADLLEITTRAMRLACDEIYVLPAMDSILIRLYRKQDELKSYELHRSRLPALVRCLKLFAHLRRTARGRAMEGNLHIRFEEKDRNIFVRVVQTSVGERVYLRIL